MRRAKAGRGAATIEPPGRFVYAVRSMRTRAVSIGVDLSTGGACPFSCDYCQVPGERESAPRKISEADRGRLLVRLHAELTAALERWRDVAADVTFAGSGEPTWSPLFVDALHVARDLAGPLMVRVMSSGVAFGKTYVREAIVDLIKSGRGELWGKLDAWDDASLVRIAGITGQEAHERHLLLVAREAPIVVQTLLAHRPGGPTVEETASGLAAAVDRLRRAGAWIDRVELSTVYRAPGKVDARVTAYDAEEMAEVAERLSDTGFRVHNASLG